MPKHKTEEAKIQSKIDNTRDAMNAANGFKSTMTSGVQGAGNSYKSKR